MIQAVLTETLPLKAIKGFRCATINRITGGWIMNQEENTKTSSPEAQEKEVIFDWVRRSRYGDSEAMESIYRHFKNRLFSLAYRYTYNPAAAEDILQDTFVKVFTNLSSLEGEKTFIGWLYRITINNCLTYIREKKKYMQRTVPLNDVEHMMSGKKKPVHEKLISKSLEKALESLPTKLKSVFLLYDVQGFKHEEVAEILGCSVGTSKSQLFKARMKIRKHLEKKQII